ncbi:hypothetical protein CQA44_08390 [Helicobacter sp. MIT 14-3879]|nr:hypothetical protein CQA44_08390 [Helicobacter sp. MIT 14-3879]
MYLKNKTNKKFSLFGFAIFSTIFTFSMLSNINDNELDRMINIYNYKDTNIIIESIKNIIVDSLVFVYFILIPVISFFYKKRVYDSYFYQTYLREIAPSLNTSIMFLFGYSIESYSFSSLYSVIDFILNISFIALFLRIAFNLKDTISFYTIMNILLLIIGFIIFLLSSEVLSRGNLYYIGIFFYSIGLLHWYLNISLKMKI